MATMSDVSKTHIERAKRRLANAYIYLHQIGATDRQKRFAQKTIAECQLTIMQYRVFATLNI